MSKLPRDVNADDLVKALCRIGYAVVRQTGSHIRLKGGTDGSGQSRCRTTTPFASER